MLAGGPMYDIAIRESYFPARHDRAVLETTVGGVLRGQAAKTPAAPALIEADLRGQIGRRWTYGELLLDCERLARGLLSRFAPGERICVWAPNAPEWVILEYAAALAGLTLVTANPGYQERELRFVLEQSKAVGLFLVREHRGNPMWRICKAAAAGNSKLRAIVDIEDHDALFKGQETSTAFPSVASGDAAQIQYTSGTTGFPKGAIISHKGITNNARICFAVTGVKEGDTALNFMPLFHTASCGLNTLGSAQFGCAMVLARAFDAPAMLDLIARERINVILGVPTMFVGLVEAQRERPRDTSSVTSTVAGGSMVSAELIRQAYELLGWNILTVYGQTESSPLLTQVRPGDPDHLRASTVGQALPQTEISIRDPVTNRVMALDAIGEICTRGYAVMIGYNENPEATAAAIDADGWLHTGDLGTMDGQGFVRLTGRLKDMIIRGGENLFPAEIEAVILEHPTVAEAAVVGMPDERWGELVVAFVRLEAGAVLDDRALIAHCRERIAAQKTPGRWIEIGEWPLTGSGKIQKFVLRERLIAGRYETAAQ
ncbi:MAG TPA: AMP-binding protein [Sphingomicrobium sp.]